MFFPIVSFLSIVSCYRFFKLYPLILLASLGGFFYLTSDMSVTEIVGSFFLMYLLPVFCFWFILHTLSGKIKSVRQMLLKMDEKYENKYQKN